MIDYWLYHITSISVSKQDMSGTFHVDMQTAPWKYRFYWIIIWREKPGILIFLPLRDLVLLVKDCKKKIWWSRKGLRPGLDTGNVARKLSEEAGWVWCVHTVWGSYGDHTMIIHDPPTPPLPHIVWGLLPGYFFPARIWTSGHLGQKLQSLQVNVRKHDWNSPVQWTRPPSCTWFSKLHLGLLENVGKPRFHPMVNHLPSFPHQD